ncbi:MAG: polyphenol oxidase family protein [Treponema sp.]|jgi:YfiH family protein|nr:polyphenol oxidase family protein [Treponema sp.]
MPMNLYPFSLSFDVSPDYAQFPLVMEGSALPSVSCAISSRSAGDMGSSGGGTNRERFFRSLGLDPNRTRSCAQVHSRIMLDSGAGFDSQTQGDGMTDRGRESALTVTVADCLPVFLYDVETEAYALLHSGWKGTGIVLNALSIMAERWGTRPASVAALLGPCIRPCCYRVDEGRAALFETEFGGASGAYPLGPVVRRNGEGPALDLQAANARLLARAGVRNLSYCVDCTFTDQRLGSFRREGAAYTRMLAVLGHF